MKYMGTGLPSFITYFSVNRTYVIYPRASRLVGTYKISVLLNDGRMVETFTFLIIVNKIPTVFVPFAPTPAPSTNSTFSYY
jgi:hypothetical protein